MHKFRSSNCDLSENADSSFLPHHSSDKRISGLTVNSYRKQLFPSEVSYSDNRLPAIEQLKKTN